MVERARDLRKRMTFPERLLWSALRKNGGGVRFRRQVNVGTFVADFCCPERRVIVEVDGSTHQGQRAREDVERDEWFARDGWLVVRVSNDDVLKRTDAVVKFVRKACEGRG